MQDYKEHFTSINVSLTTSNAKPCLQSAIFPTYEGFEGHCQTASVQQRCQAHIIKQMLSSTIFQLPWKEFKLFLSLKISDHSSKLPHNQ